MNKKSRQLFLGFLLVGSLVASGYSFRFCFSPTTANQFSYDVQLIEKGWHEEKEGLSIRGGAGVIEFQQNLTWYMEAKDLIVLKMVQENEHITIREIYNGTDAAQGLSLYNVTGTIQGLSGGTYQVIFRWENRYTNETGTLYERSVTVKDGERSLAQVLVPLTLGTTFGIVALGSAITLYKVRTSKTSGTDGYL